MSNNDLQKVKDFYARQSSCPYIKWTRDANKNRVLGNIYNELYTEKLLSNGKDL